MDHLANDVHDLPAHSDVQSLVSQVPVQPAWVRPLLDKLFEPTAYRLMLWLRGGLAVALITGQLGLVGCFGLNRFFWAWLVTFPAVLCCAGQG